MQKLPDIKNQLSSKDLFEAFKKQLVRDFEQSNFSVVTETLNDQVGVTGLVPVYLSEKIFKCIIINTHCSHSFKISF